MNLENVNVSKELKIIYMGTPDFSATVLEGLLSQYKVRAIVSQPDRPVGRNGEVRFTAVKEVIPSGLSIQIKPIILYYPNQAEKSASDGITKSPRGERPIVPTLGPSGTQERLN